MNNTSMKKCAIIASQAVDEKFRTQILEADYVVAADAGWIMAQNIDIQPDLVVGDFDSSQKPGSEVNSISVHPEKDDTDTYLAISEAIKRGFTCLEVFGCLGGRMDHSLANLQILLKLSKMHIKCTMYGSKETVFCVGKGKHTFYNRDHKYLSLLAATDIVEGVTISGVKYPLLNATLKNTYPLGISNEIQDDMAVLSLESGFLYVFFSDN